MPTSKVHSKRSANSKPAAKQTLLAGGNPQIAKASGDAPVQAYIAAMPGWKRDVGRRLDALISRAVPGVSKAVKWNSPFYGVEGEGESKHKDVRYLDIHEDEPFDEDQLGDWVKQASELPGERM
jgi:hypothetical protein